MDVSQFIERVAAAPSLLLATDFDGTIAEIAVVSGGASAAPLALESLQALSHAPGTAVAVVTGRTIYDVTTRTASLDAVWRVGEHGAEIAAPGGVLVYEAEAPVAALDVVERDAEEVARRVPALWIQRKRCSIALHWRLVPAEDRPAAFAELAAWSERAQRKGFVVMKGRSIHEARDAAHDKGGALEFLLARLPQGTLVVYAGDDTTDEPAIALARARGGIGVYITSAERPDAGVEPDLTLNEPEAWIALLHELASRRGGLPGAPRHPA
ncbi:trehalose-phosphatase [Sorangium cellulosum]|uniref:Trehalose 6-phosphate phosphatase n=1 Tax=Sorangium cellulosum TaxID=56 RepID=A0A2L0EM65_SORCE|nr:trehalose-phosphatase [Sorangium cellulosum]AUX40391.1 trehalose-phosphatase [Sorangium cellulosum]